MPSTERHTDVDHAPTRQGRLRGTSACIVGVGSMVGAACLQRFCDEGASVLAVDPSPEVAAAACDRAGDMAFSARGDLSSEVDAVAVARRCAELWGHVDALVYCGSSMEMWPKRDDSPDRWREVIEVNVLGPYVYTLAFEALLRRSPAGSIVYLGSIDGLRGNPHVPAYSASKGALVPLTHTMAQRFGSDGVRVNCVAAAGVLQTGSGSGRLRRDVGDAVLAARLTPLQRMPAADEIASVVLFLASSDASYVTGAVVPVDGGRIAATPGTY